MNEFSIRNEIDNNDISMRAKWHNVENVMYQGNSKTRTRVVRRVPAGSKKVMTKSSILDYILPTREELICDMILPAIRRGIRSKLYEL